MRAEFGLEPELIYFNTANQSPCPTEVSRAIEGHRVAYERNPTLGMDEVWGKLWAVQRDLAGFLNARPQDLFLRANVTAVLNDFIAGATFSPKKEIVVGSLEYGAVVNICRRRAEREGRTLRIVTFPTSLPAVRAMDAATLFDRVVSQLSPNTGMLVLSHVVGNLGICLPIEAIAAETRRRGILFVVDGTYAPGAIPVDFVRFADVDFYGCSLYKFMMGPKGTAFGWVNPMRRNEIAPLNSGWQTFGEFAPFSAFGEGDPFAAKMLMIGCQDFSPFLAIADTLAFWRRKGPDISYQYRALCLANLEATLGELGWTPLAGRDASVNGPLRALVLPDRYQAHGSRLRELWRRDLNLQFNVVRFDDKWHAVISPHLHNDPGDVPNAVNRLRHFQIST